MSAAPIPIVDIAALRDRSGTQAVAAQIGAACRDVGFFYISNHGVADALLARVRAALRRRSQGAAPPIVCGNVTLEPNHRTLSVFGRPLVLKRRETHLLCALMQRVGRVVERSALLDALYGFDDEVQSNTLDSHVSRLRARLNEMGAGVSIAAVRGVGYVLDARDE